MSGSSIEENNEQQATFIIQELVRCGVNEFVIAPGSRATPLVLAALHHPIAKTAVHFDERSAGYYAYGKAKGSNRLVCLIVTSGTAVANLLPAVTEAKKAGVPLIILTADRPPELQQCSANQTLEQAGIFRSAVKQELNLPPPENKIYSASLARQIDHLCAVAMRPQQGPVHINMMIREPFFPKKSRATRQVSSPTPATYYHPTSYTLPACDLEQFADRFCREEKGIIVVGELSSSGEVEAILQLAMQLQWPIFADVGSGLRSMGRDTTMIPFYNHILQTTYSREKMIPNVILYLGGRLVSKPLLTWMQAMECSHVIHVHEAGDSFDCIHSFTEQVQMPAVTFAQEIADRTERRSPSFWLSLWKEYSLHVEEALDAFFLNQKELNEPYTVFSITRNLSVDCNLFFSNSLPVRYADSFLFPKHEVGTIYTKRGVSGTDGILSIAIGLAEGAAKPLICVIGDMAFLHDIGALALLKERNPPLTIVLLNNGGGGIFHFLPIAQKRKECDEYWMQKHNYHFGDHIRAFGLDYFCAKDIDEYEEIIAMTPHQPGPRVIEICTQGDANYALHQELVTTLKQQMMRSKKEKELSHFAMGNLK